MLNVVERREEAFREASRCEKEAFGEHLTPPARHTARMAAVKAWDAYHSANAEVLRSYGPSYLLKALSECRLR